MKIGKVNYEKPIDKKFMRVVADKPTKPVETLLHGSKPKGGIDYIA